MAKQLLHVGSTSTTPWKVLLQKSLVQNSSLPYHKYMQLATVRPDGRPAVRTVVFRGFHRDTDSITFVTDRRSSKMKDLAASPCVEVCWYFPSSREQYRLSGVVNLVTGSSTDEQLLQARQEAWARMSDAGRRQFMWPTPGLPRIPADEALFLQPAVETAGPAVDNFCLGIVQVHEVDYVDLYTNRRVVYTNQAAPQADGQCSQQARDAAGQQGMCWSQTEVNP